MEPDHIRDATKMPPPGYALVHESVLRAWGKLDEVKEACCYPVQKPPNCGTGYCSCIECLFEQPAPVQEPEFITHNVDTPYDWSEWVCPDPKGYLMKCCDCGLVHEAEFKVVRYQSETEREDCEMVDDPNLQAVFRMRRSEQWSPLDTAHRAGGLPMEQPAPAQPLNGLLSVARKRPEGRVVSVSFHTVEAAIAFEQYAIEAAHGITKGGAT